MASSVLNSAKRHLGKALLASSLMASSFVNAQTGNAISGYDYLGSCTVNGTLHYYYLSTSAETWPNAKVEAAKLGGYLATLTSAGENACVTGAMFAKVGNAPYDISSNDNTYMSYDNDINAWIGLTDEVTEATWLWYNGEKSCGDVNDYRNWDVKEPNNYAIAENYAQLLMFAGDKQGKWNDWFNVETQRYIVEFGSTSCNRGNNGCTHGYYKKGPDKSWGVYDRDASFMTTFGISTPRGDVGAGTSLDASLDLKGGGYNQVAKQGTAALLNAGHGFYPYTVAEVTAAVDNMFDKTGPSTLPTVTVNGKTYTGGTFATPEALASYLDMLNNLGCPLNNAGDLQTSTSRARPTTEVTTENAFEVAGYPNPSRGAFNLSIKGFTSEKVSLKVTDATGRLVEQRTNIAANQVLSVGNTYNAGVYYVEVAQGAKKQQLKMVKQ